MSERFLIVAFEYRVCQCTIENQTYGWSICGRE